MVQRTLFMINRLFAYICFMLALTVATDCFAQNNVNNDYGITSATLSSSSVNTSITLADIIQIQKKNYELMSNGRGDVVGTIYDLTTTQPKAKVFVVFFAFDGQDSITMFQPWTIGQPIPDRWNKQTDWTKSKISIISNGNMTYNLPVKNGNVEPQLKTVKYDSTSENSNDFMLNFHPKLIGDLRPSLNELYEYGCGCLITQETDTTNTKHILVDFSTNDKTLSGLRFCLNPKKSYLAESIIAYKNGKATKMAQITIGQLPNKVYIPAKLDCVVFDDNGKAVVRENWYYRFIEINKGVPALELSGVSTGLIQLDTLIDDDRTTRINTTKKNVLKKATIPSQNLNKHDADL